MAASDDRLSDSELTPWQILANLGDSLAVVDRDYRIVWVREPLAGEAQERLVGRRCYTVRGTGPGSTHMRGTRIAFIVFRIEFRGFVGHGMPCPHA